MDSKPQNSPKYVVPSFLPSLKWLFSSQQSELAKKLARRIEIAFTTGEGKAAKDIGCIEGIFGVSQLFVRKKVAMLNYA